MVELVIYKNIVTFSSKYATELDAVKSALSFKQEGAYFSPSFKDGKWDGLTRFYKGNKFYVGLLDLVIKKLKKSKISYQTTTVDDGYIKPDISYDNLTASLYDHQKRSVLAILENRIGIMKIPTRGGKTRMAAEVIRLHILKPNKIAVFVVDTQDLFVQAIKDISEFLAVPASEIGYLKGDKFEERTINVMTIQTMTTTLYPIIRKNATKEKRKAINAKKRRLLKLIEKTSLLIIDEIQEYSGEKRIRIIKLFKKWDIFMSISASPYKSEDQMGNLRLQGVTGGIIFEVAEQELKDKGVLIRNKVLLVVYANHSRLKSLRGENESRYQHWLKNLIVNNQNRNRFLLLLMTILENLNLKTLVIFSSKKHGYIISEMSGMPFICGDDNLKTREKVKNEFLKGKGKTLLASDIYKKGVTLPEVEVLVNADGGKETSLIQQRKGRVLGLAAGKVASLTIDIIDEVKNYFADQGVARITYYQENLKEEDIIVLEESDAEFIGDLTSFLQDWFEL